MPCPFVEADKVVNGFPFAASITGLDFRCGEGMEFLAVSTDELGNQLVHDDGVDRFFELGAELAWVGVEEKLLIGQDLVREALGGDFVEDVEPAGDIG